MKAHPASAQTDPNLEAFGAGLGDRLRRFAANLGAGAREGEAAGRAAQALAAAVFSGHTCVMLADLLREGESEEALRKMLFASGVVGSPADGEPRPLVLDGEGRLYLHRYFDYERRLAARVLRFAAGPGVPADREGELRAQLDELFPASTDGAPDWQKLAAALAVRGRLTLISGGPGTGKTTTVVRILACLLAAWPKLRVALAAPTGKAAARMVEAVRQGAAALPAGIAALLPGESYTLHRLLGVRRDDPTRFRHHAGNLLALDVLVVDEASMLDIALAARLFEALPEHAKVILLGDQHQLAAVEAGAVFSTLAGNPALGEAAVAQLARLTGIAAARIVPAAGAAHEVLADTTVWLTRSYRFGDDTSIGRLAGAIRAAGTGAGAVIDTLAWRPQEAGLYEVGEGRLPEAVLDRIMEGYAPYVDALRERPGDVPGLLAAFEHHRVLCAVREGARGVAGLNEALSRRLRHASGAPPARAGGWYPGRPVIVTENDPVLKLFNGDVGIAAPDARAGYLVWFPDKEHGVRAVAAPRLPPHATALALTVHKAQGSEFERVSLVLPAKDSPVLTRELVYTAVTRARSAVSIYGSRAILEQAVLRPTARDSGLIARLREG